MRELLVKAVTETGDALEDFSVHMIVIFVFLFIYLVREGYWQKSVFVELKRSLQENIHRLWIILGMVGFSVLIIDRPVKDFFVKYEYYYWNDLLFKFGKDMGDSGILFSVMVTILICGMIWKKDRLVWVMGAGLMSSVFASLVVLLLKALITRERPDADVSPYNFFAYIQAFQIKELFQYQFLSMPSGHNVTIFSAMTPIFLSLNNRFAKIAIAVFTVMVGVSRIAGVQHWVSDTIAGASFGIWVGIIFYRYHMGRK